MNQSKSRIIISNIYYKGFDIDIQEMNQMYKWIIKGNDLQISADNMAHSSIYSAVSHGKLAVDQIIEDLVSIQYYDSTRFEIGSPYCVEVRKWFADTRGIVIEG